MSITIINTKSETVTLHGVTYRRPSSFDKREEMAITRRQEMLYNRALMLNCATEEGAGEYARICRLVTKLEFRKHPLLRVWNKHLGF